VKTYYPQSALEGFGRALECKLNVEIDYTTGQPRTDGRTVYLPAITAPLDRAEFGALCGVAIHEAAHVYFGTCRQMEWYVRSGGVKGEEALRQACFNAVVDVADETRIEGVVYSAKSLLYASNRSADEKIAQGDGLTKGDPVWAILAAGILFARIGQGQVYRAAKTHRHRSEMLKAYKILRGCKARRGKTPKPRRTNEQWRRLRSAADSLVDLVRQYGDASGAPAAFGPAGTEPAGMGVGNTVPGPQDQMADSDDGRAIAWAQDPADASSCGPSPAALAAAGKRRQEQMAWDTALYTALRPSLAGPVERLARADEADGFSSGHLSGPRIGRSIERALTDGRCFDRRNAEGEKLHVSVLLDTSGSMIDQIGKVAAIAQAFADAVRPVAASIALGTYSDTAGAVHDFRDTTGFCYEGTATDAALGWAGRALAGKTGRRVCVIITDGDPNSRNATAAACLKLVQSGVAVIGVAYLIPDTSIRDTMPRARVIGATSPLALSLQLGAIAQRIAG
jgi:hypothetical protein